MNYVTYNICNIQYIIKKKRQVIKQYAKYNHILFKKVLSSCIIVLIFTCIQSILVKDIKFIKFKQNS